MPWVVHGRASHGDASLPVGRGRGARVCREVAKRRVSGNNPNPNPMQRGIEHDWSGGTKSLGLGLELFVSMKEGKGNTKSI